VKLHAKKLKTPQMTRRILKTLELQNMKTKNFQSSQNKKHSKFTTAKHAAPTPPLFTPTQKENEDPKNDKKKIKNPQIIKKNPPKFTK